ncbi:hypothetical protein PPYR_10590 [Photinus pyralis]|uniref:Uncharacterized protein n=1 Tax=Photinus pyralis TaxID=7054 RepID=A0A5N4AGW0_PHOPY|nr:uncharacterized protein LOC116174122 isoform X1 [Photinus pyralis]XP_031347796.1 uncharacterized protein LOC116174122 isoform X1 [Photinus pyralis]KAB0796529.1 hypothetical protein PPYR_10590 [Photinus pyralis]
MVLSSEEFRVAFHSLQGITIGERRKNLFLLLPHLGTAFDFNTIQPKTPLEESFKVQLLLHFKRVPLLIEVLKSENPILIHRILREPWFAAVILDYVGEEELVCKIFPRISFNAKVKLINKIAFRVENCEKGDRLFYAVQRRYGNYMAGKLLPCCSADLIMRCLKTWKVELGSRQFILIVKRHPELLEQMLEAAGYFSTNPCEYRRRELTYALRTDLAGFLRLLAKYQFIVRVGWRSTNRLILANKARVINHASVLYSYLHRKQMVKSLGGDFNEFYLKLLPTSIDKMKCKLNDYIDIVSRVPAGKLSLLLTSFRKAYGSELWQHSECINLKLLEMMTSDERELWMNSKPRPGHISEDAWNCLFKTEKSLPLIKNKISQANDVKEMGELVGCLVETCRINKDDRALLDVCKYMVAQHRSASPSVLYSFLCTLKRCYKPVDFNVNVWKAVNELVRVFMKKKSMPYYYQDWVYAYLEYLIVNDLDAKAYIVEMSEKIHLSTTLYTCMEKEETKKICLEKYGQLITDLYDAGDVNAKLGKEIQYFETLLDWNRQHPRSQIPVPYKTLIKMLGDLDESQRYWGNLTLGKLLRLNLEDAELESCMNVLQMYNGYIDLDVFVHLAKRKPLTVFNSLDSITKCIVTMWYTCVKPFFWMYLRNYTHLEIPQKIIAICVAGLATENDGISYKRNCATALACLMSPPTFLNFIKPHYPLDSRMEVDDENQETYLLQQAITASLKHVIPPSSMLDSVYNFSKGDYLKFIQRALHSVSHGANEDSLPRLYDALVDRPVSVRKNVIYLTYKVLDRDTISAMLEQFKTTETNSSINKFIVKASFRYFLKNPSDSSWDLVQSNLKRVDANDEEVVDILVQTSKVPPSFLVTYLTSAIDYLENVAIKSKKTDLGKINLLTSIKPSSMTVLPDELFWPIIQKYLFQNKELSVAVQKFASRFVAYTEEGATRVDQLFSLIKEYIASTWESKGRKCVNDFVTQFSQLFIDEKMVPRHALRKFADLWGGLLKPYQAFAEWLQLQFTIIYVDYVDLDWTCEQIAAAICKLCKGLEYDSALITKFGIALDLFLPHFSTADRSMSELNRLKTITGVIENETVPCLLVGISLLPFELHKPHLTKLLYEQIIRRLQYVDNQTVQFALSLYFHKLATTHQFARRKKDGDTDYYNNRFGYIADLSNKYRQAVDY